jgi:phosphatidylserine decarboxylase
MRTAPDPPAFATLRVGLPYVGALALAAPPLWRWRRPAGLAALAAAGSCALFFRDPVRRRPGDPSALYAPADGTVIGVDRVERPWFLEQPAYRISVFLSIFDVHVNRCPAAGRVVAACDVGGGFAPALDFQRSHRNRRRQIGFVGDRGPFVVVQVAGLLARRIVGWVGPGDAVAAGQKLGMIAFGSRTDLLIPVASGEPVVERRRWVRGGQTPVARWL